MKSTEQIIKDRLNDGWTFEELSIDIQRWENREEGLEVLKTFHKVMLDGRLYYITDEENKELEAYFLRRELYKQLL